MVNRRQFLGITAGAGASMALSPSLLRALEQQGGKLMQRAIPSTGERLPAISFAPRMPVDAAGIREVLKALYDNGGKVIEGGNPAEDIARTAATELGLQDKFFWTTGSVYVPNNIGPMLPGAIPKADAAYVREQLEQTFARKNISKIDLVMVSTMSDVPTHVAVLQEMKKQGKVRYIGVSHLSRPINSPMPPFDPLESIMRNEPIDFIGIDYSLADRRAEETILPLAQQRKIGVMAYFPFYREQGLQRASGTPLPAWAAEFDAKTWAQFFLKFVLGHPAVSVVRTGTTKAAHMIENIGGGIGRLPNNAMRKRMAELADTFPPPPPPPPPPPGVITEEMSREMKKKQAPGIPISAAILDRYVGQYRHVAAGTILTVRRDADRMLVKVETPGFVEENFLARSETHFESVPYALDFQMDGQGRVTGAIWTQGPVSIPLVRM